MSSRFRPVLHNIPSPHGDKAGGKSGNAYTRFIPREELGEVVNWSPDTLNGEPDFAPLHPAAASAPPSAAQDANTPPAAAPEPSAEDWQAQVAAARQTGYQDGYRDGLVALESFKQSFASQATAQVGALIQAFDQQFQALDQRIADTLTRCAVEMARQVLRHELRGHPEHVARLAGEAVAAVMMSARHIAVHVHPADLPLVAEGAEEALNARGARLLADATLERGGVLVESDVGSIDARLSTRWAQAAAAFGSTLPWTATPAPHAHAESPAGTRAGDLNDGPGLDDAGPPASRGAGA
jgi:flagellar assembly protein FliH